KQPRRVHRGMMPVVTDLRGQRRIQKPLRQGPAAVEGPQKDSDQASPKSTPRRTPPHREKQARGQPTHADVEPPGPQHVPKQRRGAVIVSLGEALDGHPVPSPHAFGARHQGGLVARGRKRSRTIPPWQARTIQELRRVPGTSLALLVFPEEGSLDGSRPVGLLFRAYVVSHPPRALRPVDMALAFQGVPSLRCHTMTEGGVTRRY